jgi:hypothetical protein
MRDTFGIMVITATMAIVPAAAHAKDSIVQVVQVGDENIRYDKGVPTADLEQRNGAVQIRPLPMEHGSYVFAVAVFNDGNLPANMDTGNITVRVGPDTVGIMSVDRLIKKAKNRTWWSQFGMAMLGGLGSAAAASERNTYYGSLSTPYGTYNSYYSAPSLAGQMRAARIEDQTVMSMAAMEARLDATRAALSDQIVQLTTVDPGRMYAGKIILDKFRTGKLPQQLSVTINWNGEQYPFAFQLAEAGTPAPAFVQKARPTPLDGPAPDRQLAATAAPGPRSAIPRHVDMEGIVRRTAEVMPRPFELDSGTSLISYRAVGTELIVTANADPSVYNGSAGWEQAAYSEICTARPFAAILFQGGIVRATYLGQRKKQLGTVEASGETCRTARRS